MIATVLNWIAAGMCLVIAVRLLTFRRGRKHHNYVVAASAWILINSLVLYAMWLLSAKWSALFAMCNLSSLAYATFVLVRARGNVKSLLRIRNEYY